MLFLVENLNANEQRPSLILALAFPLPCNPKRSGSFTGWYGMMQLACTGPRGARCLLWDDPPDSSQVPGEMELSVIILPTDDKQGRNTETYARIEYGQYSNRWRTKQILRPGGITTLKESKHPCPCPPS